MPKNSYLLTEEGLKKVYAAFGEICRKPFPSKEEMGLCVGLNSDTIRKLIRRTGGVNRDTLERLCNGLGWDLELDLKENFDYELQEQGVFISDPSRSQSKEAPHDLMLGRILRKRYRITEHLGSGKFSETYLAEDVDLPGNPQCVVKRLRSQSSETAKRVFDREARVLYQLGKHDQIPSLSAHFEEDGNFYLVHQFIVGHALSQELIEGQPWSEPQIIALFQDTLEILVFVHQQNVIHRDIKPQNLIRRGSDSKIVLINFGAVKQISTGHTRTFAGTDGYMPPEQGSGTPRLCSDIYAVGILGIQALTNLHPKKLKADYNTGDIVWRDKAPQVNPNLANILDNMVRYDFRARYPSAADALQALQGLGTSRAA